MLRLLARNDGKPAGSQGHEGEGLPRRLARNDGRKLARNDTGGGIASPTGSQ